jgi:hypothetical protein
MIRLASRLDRLVRAIDPSSQRLDGVMLYFNRSTVDRIKLTWYKPNAIGSPVRRPGNTCVMIQADCATWHWLHSINGVFVRGKPYPNDAGAPRYDADSPGGKAVLGRVEELLSADQVEELLGELSSIFPARVGDLIRSARSVILLGGYRKPEAGEPGDGEPDDEDEGEPDDEGIAGLPE